MSCADISCPVGGDEEMSASTKYFQLEKETQLQDQTLMEENKKLILKVSLLTILLNYLWKLEVYLPTKNL